MLFRSVVFILINTYINGEWIRPVLKAYFVVVSAILSIIFISDLELYSYWGFRLDSTPFFYLKSPANAAASVPLSMMIILPIAMIICGVLYYEFLKLSICKVYRHVKNLVAAPLYYLLILGVLFVFIRGGVTVSTMNLGKVYFSPKQELNHAAINPAFSLMYSLTKTNDFAKEYRFYDEGTSLEYFTKLKDTNDNSLKPDSLSLLNTRRPNIVMIVLEGFSGTAIEPLGGEKGITPNLNSYFDEGVAFTNFYANSFRTDRGLVSILSGYPAQPNNSIMKYPAKVQSLPSITKSLRKNGYSTEFIYGGDADFTNMRGYFISAGMQKVIGDKDFPITDRLSKWGVNDGKMFEYVYDNIQNTPDKSKPFIKFFLTLSSHEPFEVPMSRHEDKYLNSLAYTDSCLGVFIDKMKMTEDWENTLVVILPDHAVKYPYNILNSDPERYHIPMVWIGGAVSEPRIISELGSQNDLAATLLAQLNIEHSEFDFSKDIMNPNNPKFAYFSFNNGIGMVTDTARFVFDCNADKIELKENDENHILENSVKAFVQELYNDLGRR